MFQDLLCFRQMPNRKQIDYTITNTQTRKGFNLAFSCHGHKAAESMIEKLRFEPDNSINNYVNIHIYTYTSREREKERERERERGRERERERLHTHVVCIIYIYYIYIRWLIKILLSGKGHSSLFRESFANSMFIFRRTHVEQQLLL